MTTPSQIKAARALLNWKQSELARHAGLSLPSINNIEREVISPRASTMESICNALQDAGIEFIGDNGVQRKKEAFEVLQFEGADFIKKHNDDLFNCMTGPEDEVLMCSLNERMFPKCAPDQVLRYETHQQKTKFKERILIEEGDTFLLAHPSVYRWLPKDLMGKISYLVYKNRFVIISWAEKRTVIVRNQAIADSFRLQFEYLWKIGKKIPAHTKRKLDDQAFIASLSQNKQ